MLVIELIVKERKEWRGRLEEIMGELGIEKLGEEEIAAEAESKMERLADEAEKWKEEENWSESDRVAGEAQLLRGEFPQLQDHPAYAVCIYERIYSHWQRRDEA